MRKILVHGHRGCRAVRPENTLPAFEHALKVGVDALEMDLCVTADDVLVASHDPLINEVICQGPKTGVPIRSLAYQQLLKYDCGSRRNPSYPHQVPVPGTRFPTLEEILGLGAPARVWFNIETKMRERPDLAPPPEKFAALVLDAVRRHGVAARTILQSFDYRSLRAMKKLDPKIRLSALDDIGREDFVSLARSAQADIISPRFDFVTPEKVRAAHAAGLEVVAWTANRPEDWRRLIEADVDAIISDDPEPLIAYLQQRGLR
jgi:glycerophosphoryl diester phosphodiesterase